MMGAFLFPSFFFFPSRAHFCTPFVTSAMASRRGAVKVNPVTGKMEKVEASDVPAGKHRDGCLLVDDRYVNAAKDLGMGAEKGARRAGGPACPASGAGTQRGVMRGAGGVTLALRAFREGLRRRVR